MIGPIGLTVVALACGLAGMVLGAALTFAFLTADLPPKKRVGTCDPVSLRNAGRQGRDA
jgi:hypothetical protein